MLASGLVTSRQARHLALNCVHFHSFCAAAVHVKWLLCLARGWKQEGEQIVLTNSLPDRHSQSSRQMNRHILRLARTCSRFAITPLKLTTDYNYQALSCRTDFQMRHAHIV